MDKLAKYYFGPDFWYILAARLVCLVWWLASSTDRSALATGAERQAPLGGNSVSVPPLLAPNRMVPAAIRLID